MNAYYCSDLYGGKNSARALRLACTRLRPTIEHTDAVASPLSILYLINCRKQRLGAIAATA